MARYRANQFLREPLVLKPLRPIEAKYIKELSAKLNDQVALVVTPAFVDRIYNLLPSSFFLSDENKTKSIKKQEDEELDLVIDSQLQQSRDLLPNSSSNDDIKEVLIALLLAVFIAGLKIDKKNLKTRLKKLGVDADIDPENVTTGPEIERLVELYAARLIVGLRETTIERIKVFIREGILQNKDALDIISDLTTLEGINERRAATIVRTELARMKRVQTELYFRRANIEFWTWVCANPEDVECLICCGVTRRIGENFPNGLDGPIVHPNCQCFVEAYIPDAPQDFLDFVNNLGDLDWDGSD